MKFRISLIAIAAVLLMGMSQDPRTCADPRSQFPSNPPCSK